MTNENMGQFMGFCAFAPIQLIGRNPNDHDVMFRESLAANPGGFVKNGVCQIIGIGINIDINRFLWPYANILRETYQRLRRGVMQGLPESLPAFIIMKIDISTGDYLPTMDAIQPDDRLLWAGELRAVGIMHLPMPPE